VRQMILVTLRLLCNVPVATSAAGGGLFGAALPVALLVSTVLPVVAPLDGSDSLAAFMALRRAKAFAPVHFGQPSMMT
jgi:hypothetical protein